MTMILIAAFFLFRSALPRIAVGNLLQLRLRGPSARCLVGGI